MRLSHLKAELKRNTYMNSEKVPRIRQENYSGSTRSDFDKIDETPFGRNKVPYTKNGGYDGEGGFIHYFKSDWTVEEAKQFYQNLVDDGLYNEQFVAVTLEVSLCYRFRLITLQMIFYNENRQAGNF